jgi:hypothetical protein
LARRGIPRHVQLRRLCLVRKLHGSAGRARMPASLAARPIAAVARTAVLRVVSSRPVLIIDDPHPWQSKAGGTPVEVLAPAAATPARIALLEPSRLVVNLAAPGAIGALGAVRAAGLGVPASACLTIAGTSRVLPLGGLDVFDRSAEASVVAAVIAGRLRRGTRVLTVGDDVESLVALRCALTERGMSVAMAWDARQTADLIPLVRPEVLVLDRHLGEAGTVLAAIAAGERCPGVVLLADDVGAASGLGTGVACPVNVARGMSREAFLARVAARA